MPTLPTTCSYYRIKSNEKESKCEQAWGLPNLTCPNVSQDCSGWTRAVSFRWLFSQICYKHLGGVIFWWGNVSEIQDGGIETPYFGICLSKSQETLLWKVPSSKCGCAHPLSPLREARRTTDLSPFLLPPLLYFVCNFFLLWDLNEELGPLMQAFIFLLPFFFFRR